MLTNYPGWVAEMVVDEGAGFAVPPDNPAAMADALIAAADDRAALAAQGGAAAALARRDFDRAILADRWVAWVTQGVAVGARRC